MECGAGMTEYECSDVSRKQGEGQGALWLGSSEGDRHRAPSFSKQFKDIVTKALLLAFLYSSGYIWAHTNEL